MVDEDVDRESAGAVWREMLQESESRTEAELVTLNIDRENLGLAGPNPGDAGYVGDKLRRRARKALGQDRDARQRLVGRVADDGSDRAGFAAVMNGEADAASGVTGRRDDPDEGMRAPQQ